uniref:CapZ-interacting protein n=1 Tax=Haemonchus contortus TaxID=6289 RepID=A0A7I4Y3P8_HAECO
MKMTSHHSPNLFSKDMTTASRFHVTACPTLTKFCETLPSPTMRRNEKIRALARSVQEITESEEEDESQVPSPQSSVRSPFALVESPFLQRRSSSLSSPITARHCATKRLARGLSDPCIRRPNFGSQQLSPKLQEESLGLPPIPEAATPVTPVTPNMEMKEDNENEDFDSSEKS